MFLQRAEVSVSGERDLISFWGGGVFPEVCERCAFVHEWVCVRARAGGRERQRERENENKRERKGRGRGKREGASSPPALGRWRQQLGKTEPPPPQPGDWLVFVIPQLGSGKDK